MKNIRNDIKNYTLYLTNCCQLDCPYCYEKNHRKLKGQYIMPWEDIKAIVDFAKNNESKYKPEFSMFGGEPLFFLNKQIFPLLDYLQTSFKKNEFKFTVMSNGFNLTTELVKKLSTIDDWFILISFDGPYDIIKDNISNIAFNRIKNNILNIPPEIRKKHIGLKATVSDNFIDKINDIYDYLNSFETAVIYLSPTHEIDHFRISSAIKKLGNKVYNIRDGKILKNLSVEPGIELFFKKGEITLLSHTFYSPFRRPVGWFQNGKIAFSDFLLKECLQQFPGLQEGKLYLPPENFKDCNKCPINKLLCIPNLNNKDNNHLSTTQCIWYKNILEVMKCNIQKD